MRRLCLTIVCLASAIAWTQALAQDLSCGPLKSARPHAAKAKTAQTNTASLGEIQFSNPYAPPEGATVSKRSDLVKRSDFPIYSYPTPTEPKGGLSINMGKDGGGHTTGGLSWGF
ncbi:MAG TPA: hypothetical protein VF886_06030 [Roseiarcus sp.]